MRIIGLCGRAGSGKDTAAQALISEGFVRIAFADPLKEAARAIFGLTRKQTDGDLKEVVDKFWGKSPRRIMQLLGTEAVRGCIDDDVWIKAARRRVIRLPSRRVVITDVRFPNEADAIRSWGGEIWRIERPGLNAVEPHASETAMQDYKADLTVRNEAAVEDLHRVVRIALQMSKEIER